MQNEIAAEICREFELMQGSRGNWESHWQEIAERILPAHSRSFQTQGEQTKGDKRNEYVFDSTAAMGLNKFGSILDSMLTPRNQTWHKLLASIPELMKDRSVVLWFEEVNRLLFKYRYAPNANFSSQNQQNYKALGAFGTGCVFVDELKGAPGLRYRSIHLSEIFIAENHQGIVDKVIRQFMMTARQAMQKWGEKLPKSIQDTAKKSPEREYTFLHCVKPRGEDYDKDRVDSKGMPFSSHYVSVEGKVLLEDGGYNTFPYAISRYEQAPGEAYGRSPAMDVLPAIKTLNEQKKTILKQGHKAVDPVLLLADDGIGNAMNLRPGAMNFGMVNADGRPMVHALPVGNLAVGKDLMDDERFIINDAFLVRIFQILTETPQMTATEVLERTREKGILLAPTVGRQQSEYLGPMIDREVDLLSRQNLLPPMPAALVEAGADYRTEYDSPLSRAQRAEEASGLMRTVETTLQIVNVTQNPAPLDHFDWDTIIPDISSIQGVPTKWMRDPKVVQSIREGRAAEQERQAQAQEAPSAAALIKASKLPNKAAGAAN